MQIRRKLEIIHFIRESLLTIDFLVNRISRMRSILSKNLRRPSCRSQQDTLTAYMPDCFNQRTDQRCFSSTGISFQKQNRF